MMGISFSKIKSLALATPHVQYNQPLQSIGALKITEVNKTKSSKSEIQISNTIVAKFLNRRKSQTQNMYK